MENHTAAERSCRVAAVVIRGRLTASVVAFAATFAALGAIPAGAATLTVNTTADDVTPGNGLCSLREAIAAVNTPGSVGDCAMADDLANTIVLGPHEYDLTIKPTGGDDQSTGDLDVNATAAPLTIEGAGVGQTTINGAALQDRILHALAGTTVTLEDLTITGGHAPNGANGTDGAQIPVATLPTAGSPGFDGGGILNEGALTLTGVAVTDNTAGSGGLGGYGQPDTSGPNANGQSGGAGGAGGGIYTNSPGSLTLSNVTVSGNVAGNGGTGGEGGTGGNSLTGGSGGPGGCCGDGGGLEDVGGQLSISASTFTANRAGNGGAGGNGEEPTSGIGGAGGQGQGGSSGGAIAVSGASASVSIVNSTVDANFSGAGGNGGNGGETNEPPIVDFPSGGNAGNGSAGGGLFVSGGATATLTNTTIDGNQVGAPGNVGAVGAGSPHAQPGTPGSPAFGGGIYDSTTPAATLSDTLLASNELGNCAGNITDGGHNLSFGDSDCPGTGFNRDDPKLGALADNSGPTQTQSLEVGSAAIGAGASCASTDQRGLPRPGPTCDIGAYEVTLPAVAASAASAISTTSAKLSGSVTANSVAATVVFQFGTSSSYGQTAAATTAIGLTAQPEWAALSGLTPGTTYHFRLVATSADGTSSSPDQTFTTVATAAAVAPITLRLGALKLSPARFRTAPKHGRAKGKTGTTISYTDSVTARTTLVVFSQRAGIKKGKRCVRPAKHTHGRRCTLLVKVLTLTHTDKAGANTLRFNRHLAAGKYRLQVTARAGGQASKTLTAAFTVLRPR
jgi:CSLREA domain-containing protein